MKDWLFSFAEQAEASDQLRSRENHTILLAAGLYGEAGSILSELKKSQREGSAYPHYRHRLAEEFGDALWYFVRLVAKCDPGLLSTLPRAVSGVPSSDKGIASSLRFGAAVGDVLRKVQEGPGSALGTSLDAFWGELLALAAKANVKLQDAAAGNVAKVQSRWPATRDFARLFDENCPPEEQLPRTLTVEFHERRRGSRIEVLLQYQGITIGDRLTDNIADPDDYRYHDVFHMAYAVFLGWSPVTRALLRCKRKSQPAVDENEDGARAGILEEAVSAVVFSRAKNMRYFEIATELDYDLLKIIQEIVRGYEAAQIPLWQWERAILEGFRVFRLLRANQGGAVSWSLPERRFEWSAITTPTSGA
jgi:MazG-like nucleotide pyrophosphohydrolase family protein